MVFKLSSLKLDITAFIQDWPELYRYLGLTPQRYLLQVVVPLSSAAIALPWIVINFNQYLPDIRNLIRTSFIVSIFLLMIIPAYPYLWKEAQMRKAEAKVATLLTQMAILSTGGPPAVHLITKITKMEEYDPLIATMKWVNMLVKRFHMPASEALSKVAKETSSKMIREFLERFSHAVEVGEPPKRFLINEQDVAMDTYSSEYISSLSEVEGMKESLASLITAALFLATFLMLVPILTAIDITKLLLIIVLVFSMIEGFNAFVVLSKLPVDEVWYKRGHEASRKFPFPMIKYVRIVMVLGLFLVGILAKYLMQFDLPVPIWLSLSITPMLLPGIIISIEEQKIKDREANFAPFMRALGRAGELKGETFIGNLRRLSLHEFGYLNDAIRNLTRRLSTRIKPVDAWRYFSAETGSNLINRYAEMYVQGTESGGNPREISTLIDINLVTGLELRQDRARLAGVLTGIFYGLMVAIAFTLYVSLNLLEMMGRQVASLEVDPDTPLAAGFVQNLANTGSLTAMITIMITAIILIHAFISSSVIARLKGGHPASGYVHFVALLWCGTVTSFLTNLAISSLF